MEHPLKKNKTLFKHLEEFWEDELEEFLKWVKKRNPVTIRVNSLKITKNELEWRLKKRGISIESLPFYDEGFVIREREEILSKIPEHFLGYFYIQEASSMIPPLILSPKEGEWVLDIAAAPGSKTTQMAQMMKNRGVIVANDISYERIKALSSNLDRLGVLNTVVTELDGYKLGFYLEGMMDKVLVDAPCTALGTLHKSRDVVRWWSYNKVGKLVRIQRGLILAGFKALKPEGKMVYSTCTLVPEENEGVVNFLLEREPDAELLPIEIEGLITKPGRSKWKRNRFSKEIEKTCYIIPHKNEMEGFFIALIKKRGTP